MSLGYAGSSATGAGGPAVASGWALFKYPQGQPACTGAALRGTFFDGLDCGFGRAAVSGTDAASKVFFDFVGEDGKVFETRSAIRTSAGLWEFTVRPTTAWPAGQITLKVRVDGVASVDGQLPFYFNQLGGGLTADSRPEGYEPGQEIPLSGLLYELDTVAADELKKNVPATFSIRVVTATGEVRGPYGPFTADKGGDGQIRETLPGAATAGLTATAATNYETTVALELVDASYKDALTGTWRARSVSAGYATLHVPPPTLVLENSFVSARGWVKPGESYPFRVFVKNFATTPVTGATVTLPVVDGTTFAKVAPAAGSGTAKTNKDGSVTWSIGDVPGRTDAGPGVGTLVVEARADTLEQDPKIVWKDVSSSASLTYGTTTVTDASHGPKVIPPSESFDTARYGDRPFPVVPVDYVDRKHESTHSAERLLAVINSKDVPGSTFNLFQEMSFGQLYPSGTVPSAAVARAGWDVEWKSDRYKTSGFTFTTPNPTGACVGTTTGPLHDTPATPDRIKGGWYQLPGDTNYYGGDKTNMVGTDVAVLAGSGALIDIDSACGPIAKSVYDAAHIADPEIDYSDFDTDKDGVVDFFMMVFVGNGGNGVSQLSIPPYDNIWPHSSSLEFYYEDDATGLTGYISDDQLRDNQGRLLYYTDAARQRMTTTETAYPVYVRVGPYNVNPESAIEKASVISHEYGHSLGLPDFYSSPGRSTYGDWNLMATDKSQNMDVYSKQELGWIVPRPLPAGETTVSGWRDSKADTNRIDWQSPDGTPYTLTGPNVHNGEAYTAKLPGRILIDPAKIANGASPDHVWWSRSGNDFGCTPLGGRNLDLYLPELATVAPGTPVTLSFKSNWEIEWDYDYGFVLATTDGGETYTSFPSQKGFTTPVGQNPNANGCQAKFGNGITGSTGSYVNGTTPLDRQIAVDEYPEYAGFVEDQYDLSSLAGKTSVLRFSYATDPGLAKPGWFIDDVRITAGDRVIYDSNMETGDDERIFNGGCEETLAVAKICTAGWQWVSGSSPSEADHGYYMELRDRSSFDLDGKGQNDRDPIGFIPGLLLTYTDEAHGYGNVGVDGAPAQSPLDANPQPGVVAPNLNDAAFSPAVPRFSDAAPGRVDNYKDPSRDDGLWRFDYGCLTFDVLSMSGEGIGPATAPGDLTADVRFTTGSGCAAFDYGYGAATKNFAPIAVAQAKPTSANVRQPVRFDGSASSDDKTAPRELGYRWDFDGNGTWDATGVTARHAYGTAGTYTARLQVTDAGGLTDVDTVTITVS